MLFDVMIRATEMVSAPTWHSFGKRTPTAFPLPNKRPSPSLRGEQGRAIPGVSSLGSNHQGGKAKFIGNINLHVAWGKHREREINAPASLP